MKTFSILICILSLSTAVNAGKIAKLQKYIDSAVKNGKKEITIPAGIYKLDKPICLKKINNTKIKAEGVTLIMGKFDLALRIDKCSKLTITGLTIDYDPLPFTQATVTEVKGKKLKFKLHKGYPRLTRQYAVNRAHVFDGKTRLWKQDEGDLYGKNRIISPEQGEFTSAHPINNIQSGDYIVLNIRKAPAIGIYNLSENIRMENVTILASSSLGIIERFALGGDYFKNVVIKRGPIPKGATQPRLFSTCADGLNFAYNRNGPTLDGCNFSFMGDDSVNLHAVALPVIKVINSRTFLTARPYNREGYPEIIYKGDELRLLNKGNFAIKDSVEITSFTATDKSHISYTEIKKLFPTARRHNDNKYTVYKITCEQPLKNLNVGDFVDIPAIGSPGFKIINSFFHDHRARGLRIMSTNGIIANNRLERIKNSAITVGAEYAYWREAGWVNNIIIKNNKLKNIGTGLNIRRNDSYTPGALCVFTRMKNYKDCPSSNRNILFENNSIDGCPVSAFFINGADGVTLKNNTWKNVCYDKTAKSGSSFGLYSDKAVNIKNSKNVKIIN